MGCILFSTKKKWLTYAYVEPCVCVCVCIFWIYVSQYILKWNCILENIFSKCYVWLWKVEQWFCIGAMFEDWTLKLGFDREITQRYLGCDNHGRRRFAYLIKNIRYMQEYNHLVGSDRHCSQHKGITPGFWFELLVVFGDSDFGFRTATRRVWWR